MQKRPRANIRQYGPEQVKLVSSLLSGIIFLPNKTSGSSFKPISRRDVKERTEPAILSGFRISLMIIAVDRQKLVWLLKENCSSFQYYMCQLFVVLYNTR